MPDDIHMAPTLVDLVGRNWDLPGAVTQAVFNHDGSAVAFADGQALAVVPVADPERAETRVRFAADTGRHSISPRQKPVRPPVIVKDVTGPVVPYGGKSFLAVSARTGGLISITPRGQVVPLSVDMPAPVVAMSRDPGSAAVAVGAGSTVIVLPHDDPGAAQRIDVEETVTALAHAPDGRQLAVGRDGSVAFLQGADWAGGAAFDGLVETLSFSPAGRFLACGLATPGFVFVRCADMTGETVLDYATPVASFAWNSSAQVLATSGAFRTVAWELDEDGLGEGTLVGRTGLVIVDRVAASPDRPLIATGYANGLLCLARVGSADEIMLRPDGGALSALTWASDGVHLAFGDADGAFGLLSFPPSIFK